MTHLSDLFLLDPSVHFLNHGSFGACPKPVFDVYQAWQRRLEAQPVLFLGREYPALMLEARTALADYLGAAAQDLVYIPNATHGVNIVARSLRLAPGDEILSTDHEYGACDNAWQFLCQQSGARYLRQPLPLPFAEPQQIVEQIWRGVTPRTRLLYLSHITSPTALLLPVQALIQRARQAGILTLIDGAHAPGQIPLHLPTLGADFYTGNCHKWMLAPKGAGFLYARPEVQPLLNPLVVSWGYSQPSGESCLVDYLQWTGTQDPAAWLSVPAAIQFMRTQGWEEKTQAAHLALVGLLEQVNALTGQAAIAPSGFYRQMGAALLPPQTALETLKARLYEEYRVEVPLLQWNEHKLIRISVQPYNTPADFDALLQGLRRLL